MWKPKNAIRTHTSIFGASSICMWVPWCLLSVILVYYFVLCPLRAAAKVNYFICQPGKLLKRIQVRVDPFNKRVETPLDSSCYNYKNKSINFDAPTIGCMSNLPTNYLSKINYFVSVSQNCSHTQLWFQVATISMGLSCDRNCMTSSKSTHRFCPWYIQYI